MVRKIADKLVQKVKEPLSGFRVWKRPGEPAGKLSLIVEIGSHWIITILLQPA